MNIWLVAVLTVSAVDVASPPQVRVVRYGDDRLAGITQVDVLVSTTGDAARCSIDRVQLQQAAVETLHASQIKATVSEKASSWFYSVLVTAQAAAVGDVCATAIATELVAQVEGIPDADRHALPGTWGSLLVGPLSLIRETAMVASPAKQHAVALQTAFVAQMAAIGERSARQTDNHDRPVLAAPSVRLAGSVRHRLGRCRARFDEIGRVISPRAARTRCWRANGARLFFEAGFRQRSLRLQRIRASRRNGNIRAIDYYLQLSDALRGIRVAGVIAEDVIVARLRIDFFERTHEVVVVDHG